jgi:hypothetical protein
MKAWLHAGTAAASLFAVEPSTKQPTAGAGEGFALAASLRCAMTLPLL